MMRLLISGGGTGGGTYPAIAVAQALRHHQPGAELLWIGSQKGIEGDLVRREGIPFQGVASGPLVGKNPLVMLTSAIKIGLGTLQALPHVRRFKPHALLMTGGWPVIPATLACALLRVPIFILLPDIEPGSTIRLLSRLAHRVLITTPESASYFRPGQCIEVGYPLRADLLAAAGFDAVGGPLPGFEAAAQRAAARRHFSLAADRPALLIFGGSKGTQSLNEAALNLATDLAGQCSIIHITGQAAWDALQSRIPTAEAGYQAHPYLQSDEMGLALAAADLVISRAGASTLGEFPLFGLPAILVPYPYTWRYQKVNADYLVKHGAGLRIDDEELPTHLMPTLRSLLQTPERLPQMAAAAAWLKQPEAAWHAAEALLSAAEGNYTTVSTKDQAS